jgi:N utilization substance protein A
MQLDTMMEAIDVLARERGVEVDAILDAFANALVAAYKRSPGAAEEARVTIDPESGEVTVYAQELDEDGNVISEWEDTPEGEAFGRIAAQSFKQVMQHKLREAKRERVYEMYEGREGDLITGLVQQVDYRSVILDLGDAEAILPGSERIPFERLERGNRVKALILEVQGSSDRRCSKPPRPGPASTRARSSRADRRNCRDRQHRPRARSSHQDRGDFS